MHFWNIYLYNKESHLKFEQHKKSNNNSKLTLQSEMYFKYQKILLWFKFQLFFSKKRF